MLGCLKQQLRRACFLAMLLEKLRERVLVQMVGRQMHLERQKQGLRRCRQSLLGWTGPSTQTQQEHQRERGRKKLLGLKLG